MSKWHSAFDLMPPDDAECVLVWCEYAACKERNVAYVDNGLFYSEETDEELPVTHWAELAEFIK